MTIFENALADADRFKKEGFQFFFYSNEHSSIQIHVRKGSGEAVFFIEGEVELRESYGLKIKELAKAQELAETHKTLILRKWHEHFN